MKHGIQIKLPSFLLALAIVLSLCGCAVNPQELLNQLDLPQMSGKGKESEGEPPEKEATPSESTAPSGSAGTQKPPEKNQGTFPSNGSSQNDPYNLDPPQYVETAEGKDSLIWLREKMNFPGMTFGAAYLGYVGGLFEEAFATGFPKWLQETNSGMLAEYPFIGEIGGERIIGRARRHRRHQPGAVEWGHPDRRDHRGPLPVGKRRSGPALCQSGRCADAGRHTGRGYRQLWKYHQLVSVP